MDPLEYAQAMFAGRLAADPYFADVAVLLEQKGVTEADIDQALAVLNPQGGKLGTCIVVLMPTLKPDNTNAPSPTYRIEIIVQVIDMPLIALGEQGNGKSAAQIAQRVRQLLHLYGTGERSVWTFAGQEPITQDPGRNSYGVAFARQSGDPHLPKVPNVQVDASGTGPVTISLSCADAAAEIWYTLDSSYPWPGNTAAVRFLPNTAVDVASACTLLAAAYRTGHMASNITTINITVADPQPPQAAG